MLDTYAHYSALRVRWYARTSAAQLLRHWQWFLIAGLFVPGTPIIALFGLFLPFLIYTLSPGNDLLLHAASLAGVQCAAFLWILPQRRNLGGGDFAAYAAALPIPPIVRRGVDVTLLLIADSPIIVAIAFALQAAPPGYGSAHRICTVLVLIAALLLLQTVLFRKGPVGVVFLAAGTADLLLGSGLASGGRLWGWAALLSAAGVVLAAWLTPDARSRTTKPAARPHSKTPAPLATGGLPPSFLVQCKALAARPISTVTRLAVALCAALGADQLMAIFAFDERSAPTAVGAMALAALVLSGLGRILREAHAPMQGYMATLPAGGRFWAVRDTGLVLSLGVVPFVILLVPLIAHRLSPPPSLAALALAYGALVVMLRLVLALSRRLSVLLATALAAGWTGAAIAAIVR